MLLTLYRIRYSNHRQIRRKSLAGQQDCIHQRHHPAPNFGKTFCPYLTTGQSWAFGDAASLSEIGRRGVKKRLVYLISLDCPILPVVGQEIFLLGIMEHSLHLKCLLMG